MADPAPLPPQNTFGTGPPVHRESLASSTALGQDLDKTRLITEWQRQVEDGRETSFTSPPKDEADPEADPSEYKDPEDFYKDIKQDVPAAVPPAVPSAAPAVGQAQPPTPNQRSTKIRWNWDPKSRDFVRTRDDGTTELYTEYQRQHDLKKGGKSGKPRGDAAVRTKSPPPTTSALAPPTRPKAAESDSSFVDLGQDAGSRSGGSSISSRDISKRPPRPKRPFEEPLNPLFEIVQMPKRFFSTGRIFKTPWFEPGGTDAPGQPSDREWRDACPPFHSTKPMAKFRWFVVVRRRPSHTLCFSITTFGGAGAARERRDRATDFVVLHKAEIEAPDPHEEEGITRAPLKVIIEEGEQYISPLARLDCGRVYTVENNLRVLKIGRIHTDSLPALEEYYRDSVLS